MIRVTFLRAKILFRGRNESVTDAAAPLFLRNNECNNFSGNIIMFVAQVRQRADHSAEFFADLRDKRAVTRIGQKIDFKRILISSLVVS